MYALTDVVVAGVLVVRRRDGARRRVVFSPGNHSASVTECFILSGGYTILFNV